MKDKLCTVSSPEARLDEVNSSVAKDDFIDLTGGAAGSFDVLSTEQRWSQSGGIASADISSSVLHPEDTWLPTVLTYCLNKELEEAPQCRDTNVSLHLKETLNYFEQKMKINSNTLTNNHVNCVTTSEGDTNEHKLEVADEIWTNNWPNGLELPEIDFNTQEIPAPKPAHQNSPSQSACVTRSVTTDVQLPEPAYQNTTCTRLTATFSVELAQPNGTCEPVDYCTMSKNCILASKRSQRRKQSK